jgi:hypothetical protein
MYDLETLQRLNREQAERELAKQPCGQQAEAEADFDEWDNHYNRAA